MPISQFRRVLHLLVNSDVRFSFFREATSAFSDDDGGATTADGSAGSTDDRFVRGIGLLKACRSHGIRWVGTKQI